MKNMLLFLSCMINLTLQLTAQTERTIYYDSKGSALVDTTNGWDEKIVLISPNNDNTGTIKKYNSKNLLYISAPSNNLKAKTYHGLVTRYRTSSQLIVSTTNYTDNLRSGEQLDYFPNGKLAVRTNYVNDEIETQTFYTPEGLVSTVNLFDIKATPSPNWQKFISSNLKYPKEARRKEITGRVLVEFIVEKDGSLSSFKAKIDPNKELTEEAIRVIKLLPNFSPAVRDGAPIRAYFTLPINFTLSKKNKS